MNRKRAIMTNMCIVLVFLIIATNAIAQDFNHYFTDATLRIDYTLAGNANHQYAALDELCSSPHWFGKRNRLAEVPMEGNGQIIMRAHSNHEMIYRNSFSTLFQEWLSYDEAKTTTKSFEHVVLVPMPKDTVDISLVLYNNRRERIVEYTQQIIPSDILIRHTGERNKTPYVILQQAADTTHCIHIAFIAEGYKESEMQIFLNDAKVATDAIFAHEPFKMYRNRFNIVAVEAPSTESGTSEPSKGIWKNTALHSHFDTFYSDRYLTTLHLKDMHDWLAGIPYEHIIVLVNTEKYGGGGILNFYNLAMAHHDKFKPVVVHEFGHSFAGLGDEYAYESEQIPMYPHDIEPWEPNLTTKVNFHAKWEDMMTKGKAGKGKIRIGLYEGAGYSMKGVYRGCEDCRMKTNEYPEFCPVCQRALQNVIKFYTE